MIVSWTAPDANGASITQYDIQIKYGASSYSATNDCDGTDTTVVSTAQCTIPMATFRTSPYTLAQGTLIEIKVAALNSNGWSSFSSDSTGSALVEYKPTVSTAPTEDAATDDTQLIVDYAELTGVATGGSSILEYELSWDNASGGASWAVVKSETSSFTYTSTQTSGYTVGLTY